MTKTSTIPVPTAAMLICNNGHVLPFLQFTLSSFGSLQAACQDLGISCVVMSAVPLNKLMVLSKREKQIKY